MTHATTVEPGEQVRLDAFDADSTSGLDKPTALAEMKHNIQAMNDLAYRLYAEKKRALLLILQGLDGSGKDGTLRHVMSGVSPQSCQVVSFRTPTDEELRHDFLWRVHRVVPAHGFIGIFNRSHYEDVIVVRVRKLVPHDVWQSRYESINHFEQLLHATGTTVIKCFLHISKKEQGKRLQKRLNDPKRRWKLDRSDLEDRKCWDDYVAAYEDALSRCNTHHAPWHIVPANHKWHRNWFISRLLRKTLEQLDPKFPPPSKDLEGATLD
ncbi:MAG TPA: polyphosphate kinase 2 family protein [Pirellulales bacterium]|nr:polyphosphate kinase 2 family protein [Pirellulales bacterium]